MTQSIVRMPDISQIKVNDSCKTGGKRQITKVETYFVIKRPKLKFYLSITLDPSIIVCTIK